MQEVTFRACAQCGTDYEIHRHNRKSRYCSLECAHRALSGRGAGPVAIVCASCGESFTVKYKKRAQRYCSPGCRGKARADASRLWTHVRRDENGRRLAFTLTERLCEICKTAYTPNSARQRWCAACIPDKQARARYRYYKITEPQWREMVARHGGKCWICRNREAVCVDHDHATGAVRGALCQKCNQALGFIEAPDWFAAARTYLGWR